MGGNWDALQDKHTIKTLALTSHKHLESSPNPTPPPLTWLHHTQALVHVGSTFECMCTSFEHTCSPI